MRFSVDFLNTYRPSFFEKSFEQKMKRTSCSTVSVLAASVPFHQQQDLFSRKSICHDLTNEVFQENGFDAPLFTPAESAQILVHALEEFDFLMFEFFLTDLVGHAQDMDRAKKVIQRLEAFLESALSNIDLSQCTFLLISDHGNFEDLSTRSHTKNPALFMTWGQYAEVFIERCNTIQDPYHVILELMTP
jgi:phosphopentomutase